MKSHEILTFVKLLSIIVIFFNGTTSALRVDIVPDKVDDISTDTVTITCRATESPDGTRNVVLMELGKRGEHPLVTLGKTKLKYGANKNSNMKAHGNTSQSYLRLTIKNPEMENGGVYVCRLFYVDGLGELKDVTAYGNMTVQSSSKSSEQLLEELFTKLIQNLTDKVTSLEKTVTDQEKQLQEQTKHSKEQDAKVTSLLKTVTDQDEQLQEQTGKVTSLEKTVIDQEKQLQEQTKHLKELDAKVSANISELSDKEKINHGLIQDLAEKESFVSAFSAGYDSKDASTPVSTTMVFSQSYLDVGHDYNTTTGVYTAPRRGLYTFTILATASGIDKYAYIELRVNDHKMALLFAHDKDYHDQSSVSTLVTLQAGDKVSPVVIGFERTFRVYPSMSSLFSGCLLQPL